MYLKKTLLILLFTAFFLTPAFLLAQELPTPTDAGRTRKKLNATGTKKSEEFKLIFDERIKEASESFKQKRAELQHRLESIANEKKRKAVLSINDKMADTNRRRSEKMMNALVKLNSLLDRLSRKVETAKTRGTDATAVEQAIADAQASIEIAQVVVVDQAAKVYTIEIADQQRLKTTVGQAVSKMNSKLRAVKSLVIEAKQKVSRAVKEAARVGIGKIGKKVTEATPASTLTPIP
ncbi:hypothetical protein HY612_02980 [Candidatus Roizmanbacteria bacterium]|nr:hypothetical protein [Candidatus Roizmanbacteria bacterium]